MGLMKMAVCSTVFNSRQSALCVHSGTLQSVQHVSNPDPIEIMSHLLGEVETWSTTMLC